jgi:hypothetical protein
MQENKQVEEGEEERDREWTADEAVGSCTGSTGPCTFFLFLFSQQMSAGSLQF